LDWIGEVSSSNSFRAAWCSRFADANREGGSQAAENTYQVLMIEELLYPEIIAEASRQLLSLAARGENKSRADT
jgi:hypothetical protein